MYPYLLIHINTNPYIPINTHTYLTILIYTHTYPSISIYTNKCIPIQIHIYPYIPLYTHTYPYIPIHTHTYPNITIHIYLPKNTLHNVIQVILSLRVYPLVIYFGEGNNFIINAQGHLSKTLLTSSDSNIFTKSPLDIQVKIVALSLLPHSPTSL